MESRSLKSARNIFTGVISKLLTMLLAFITRTIFIRMLGVEYNGINGLYSNILSILALSELGIGNVLNYTLYRALQKHDEKRINALVFYFKKIYRIIAFAVLGVGLLLVPILPYIVNSDFPQEEVVTYYILYLLNSVVSYFVVYKTTVIVADQNNYISSICETVTTMLMYVFQVIYLLAKRDFWGYLVIQVLCMVLRNVILNAIANRKYPYLKHLDPKNQIGAEDKRYLFDNIKATFLYKLAGVIVNNTDNLLISIIVGTVFVGYYSNYSMIISYIASFVSIFITGITASLGNLNAEDNEKKSYETFQGMVLVFSFIGAVVSSCLVNCLQGFIAVWIGDEHVMPMSWVIVIVLNNYLSEVMSPIWMFRETMGLFQQVKYVLLVTAGLNIVLSIALGIPFGVPGILFATALSKLMYQYWYEPKLLFHLKFKKSMKNFFSNQFRQFGAGICSVIVSWFACSFLEEGLIGLIIRALLSAMLAFGITYIFNCRSNAWNLLYHRYILLWMGKLKRKLGVKA